MALQSSGAISLNDIHVELGATSSTTVSLNDTDVRALVSISSGAIALDDFYGASAAFSTTITEGVSTFQTANYYGLRQSDSIGSANPANISISGNTHPIRGAYRRINKNSRTGAIIAGSSSFWMEIQNTSGGVTAASDAFDSVTLTFDGHSFTLDRSDAITLTFGSGSTGRRDFRWFSSSFPSTSDHLDFEDDIDGTGSFTLGITF